MKNLINKYNQQVPRYTSYPPVPDWNGKGSVSKLKKSFLNDVSSVNSKISLYIHLPFCENLCTYCACNTHITKNHSWEERYSNALIQEWQIVSDKLPVGTEIAEIHLGGGTPTFFSANNLEKIIRKIIEKAPLSDDFEGSFEAHPSNTTLDHLNALYGLGFRRLSVGVQDFDPIVQKTINRIQSYEEIKSVIHNARQIGYNSINMDLIYGLPNQHLCTLNNTINKVIDLKPDRIAFYSYAHVPWVKPAQQKFDLQTIAQGAFKRNLFITGEAILIKNGYHKIGFDHFALKSDPLSIAFDNGDLHRNFMGYAHKPTHQLIGLGASAISETKNTYVQNDKYVKSYIHSLNQGDLPIINGHILSPKEHFLKQALKSVMCNFYMDLSSLDLCEKVKLKEVLKSFVEDELVRINFSSNLLEVTYNGREWVRNIAFAIDSTVIPKGKRDNRYSKAI